MCARLQSFLRVCVNVYVYACTCNCKRVGEFFYNLFEFLAILCLISSGTSMFCLLNNPVGMSSNPSACRFLFKILLVRKLVWTYLGSGLTAKLTDRQYSLLCSRWEVNLCLQYKAIVITFLVVWGCIVVIIILIGGQSSKYMYNDDQLKSGPAISFFDC